MQGRPPAELRCGECGGEICQGESYWYINGGAICADCLPDFARSELEPLRRVRGREGKLL